MTHTTEVPQESALLVGVALPGVPTWEAEESLDELARLADTATLAIVGKVLQNRKRIDPTFYIGKGKANELQDLAGRSDADMIIFDNDLSPAQMRNLEKLTDKRILDRSAIILDIFALHARSRTAQVQVELAQLNYLMPRLTRQWSHLSRQAGGGAIRGMGAAGVRGPGETQLEIDRRLIRGRISQLQRELKRIGSQMATSRKSRGDSFRVALVGYTNAGKSTLMRALSGSDVLVQDQLFATLDSTTRAVDIDQRHKILLTDTVGFIRRLPHHLVASFRATLEETIEADLLLHVVDLSHPHYDHQMETVQSVLNDLGVEDRPTLTVFNKIDQIGEGDEVEVHIRAAADQADRVAISAHTGDGLEVLRDKILARCQEHEVTLDLRIPQAEGRLLSQLHEQGEILEQSYDAEDAHLRVRLGRAWAQRWELERYQLN
ncbi:MAG TPA: GTPase HflX [Candidatus Latescibacteria bacterium]|jgi:GTP-binding protein HflX|nr:GTPase HflX [Gemmatimonadaceae bacterium]MDP6016173.1 GTPase HflX [Candidatus Latescibacterota bacterium]HJP31503.1 GTPase HflX [Candidatus Latescibacterota bacterium]